ncbi:hypothetical protein Tco_1309328, partial [Tanacetum coccineum]
NKNVDTSLRTGNDRHTGQFGNQRTVTVAGNKETVGNQESKGIPLSVKKSEWLQNTNEKPDEQELEAHYMYMERFRRSCKLLMTILDLPMILSHWNSNAIPNSSDMCDNEGKADHNTEEHEDERV